MGTMPEVTRGEEVGFSKKMQPYTTKVAGMYTFTLHSNTTLLFIFYPSENN